MTLALTSAAAAAAASPPVVPVPAAEVAAFGAALRLLTHLERGERIDAAALRSAMEAAFGASDTTGAWTWKTAYDACEAATVLFLQKYGKALFRKAASPAARLSAITKITGLLPTHTRRSEESQALQQFSTPTPLGLAAVTAAAIAPGDVVLEPSAGTGLLAILAQISGGELLLNELADARADLLAALFPAIAVSRFDAAQIDDHLPPTASPTVVIMNPPFSAMANVSGRMADAACRHVASALARLADGGRLIAITGANFGPEIPTWTDAFTRLQERGRVVFTAAIDGSVYARHGTTIEIRLTVIDKLPADDPAIFPTSAGVAPDVATLLGWIEAQVPSRLATATPPAPPAIPAATPRTVRGYLARASVARPAPSLAIDPEGVELAYETVDWTPPEGASLTEAIYEEYGLQSIRIPGAQAHPTKLVQSAAMASIAPPKPSYRPMLPANICDLLSDAQLETVIFAGEAHSDFLAGSWTVDETFDLVKAAPPDAENAVRFRRGYMLGDGTGAGKGRQSAGIILDNWLRGRRKAVWVSKSDKLIEDAQRDWSALGMERLLVTPLSRFPQGKPITLSEGILFTTYATLRSDDRGEKVSRVRQIVDWLGSDFDGAIIFDEAHAMQNAAGGKGERGDVAASQQGRAEDWSPSGIDDLEPAAWNALRHAGSACVVAGPGAGKTEFLAQRADYLLGTGLCRAPHRVLAISFKTDAANNLAARVRQRCPPEFASRFVSVTFDAFTKSLVDRFLNAVPQDWRPTRPYEIAFPKRKAIEGFLTLARLSAPPQWQAEIAGYSASDFEPKIVGSFRLPTGPIAPQNAAEFTIARWWATQLRPGQTSAPTFVGINRLAELLLRANPHIRRALVATYPFVFVDEFQDTTYAQYDFLHSAFSGGQTIITGVGDDKQRIMVFAGARQDAFQRLEADFGGTRFPLLFNFRSSPDLVAIQHVVARALDPNTVQTVAQTVRQVDGDVAQVWSSQTMASEAAHLAQWIANDMATRGRAPRDYALLVKQKSDDYEHELAGAFAVHGLRIRNESHTLGKTSLQDLLSDDLSRLAIAILRLGATRRAPAAWQLVSASVLALRATGPDDDARATKVEADLTAFLAALRTDMAATAPSQQSALDFAKRVFDYLDLDAIARTYAEYGVGDQLQIILEAFCVHFFACANGAPHWTACLDAFEGVGQVPMMTVHKSKGLEYDTIIFVGLDDRAWWAHTPGDPEGVAAFFVALSRAKQRAIFAFCQQRGNRNNVAELYQLLTSAGVPEIAI